MSDEIKKTVLSTLAEPISNSAKNITDKPTQNIGTTLADIWYLVFGSISQAAEKRKLKYTYALQAFENELKEKISKIPERNLVDADIQIIAQAFEAIKYCVEKEELRHMFSSLISSSLNKDITVSPIFINIVRSLSSIDAKILSYYFEHHSQQINIQKLQDFLGVSSEHIANSLIELEHMNLIYSINENIENTTFFYKNITGTYTKIENTKLSVLGLNLCNVCLRQ